MRDSNLDLLNLDKGKPDNITKLQNFLYVNINLKIKAIAMLF